MTFVSILKKIVRTGPEIYDFPEDIRNRIAHLGDGRESDLSIAQNITFKAGEDWTKQLADEIVETD